MAPFMRELQEQVMALRRSAEVESRGFFTPSEEEQARHLHVSYWQTRSALFELIYSVQDEFKERTEYAERAFLIAFAAALLMIDAARFLSENFDDIPPIVEKLNQPDSAFGIPARTYDVVQESLTNPANVWRIYRARRFWKKAQPVLERISLGDPSFRPAYETIEELKHRIEVSPDAYAKARLKFRSRDSLSDIKDVAIGQIIYGLQEFFSKAASDISTDSAHTPSLPSETRSALLEILRPGDILVTRKEHALTNYFLPGYWPHAALYLGTPGQLTDLKLDENPAMASRWERMVACDRALPNRVLESLKDGVRLRSLASPFASDALTVIRPRLSEEEIAKAIGRGIIHEGKPYDFDFDFTRSDRLVCTEVIYRSYEGIAGVKFNLTKRAGRWTLSAEDLLAMAENREHFHRLAVHKPDSGLELFSS